MIIGQLFDDPYRRTYAAKPEMDALTEEGALQEADLIGMSLDVGSASLGLLFDLRTALQLRTGNAAVIIARGLTRFEWANCYKTEPGAFHSFSVISSKPEALDGLLHLMIDLVPDAGLTISAPEAEFFVGDVPDITEVSPNLLGDSLEEIRRQMPSWSAEFRPLYATFLDPM